MMEVSISEHSECPKMDTSFLFHYSLSVSYEFGTVLACRKVKLVVLGIGRLVVWD